MKEDLSQERDEHLSEIVKLREQLTDSQNRQVVFEDKQTEATMKIQEVGALLRGIGDVILGKHLSHNHDQYLLRL